MSTQTSVTPPTYPTPAASNSEQLIACILHARVFLPARQQPFSELRTRTVEDYVRTIIRS
jgi:hypothetical protein